MSRDSIPIKDLPLYIEQLCLQLQKMDYSEVISNIKSIKYMIKDR